METYICEQAGQNIALTAYAMLQERYEVAQSDARLNISALPLAAAHSDLVFGFVTTPAPAYPTSHDDPLHGQLVVKHLSEDRVKSALWHLSRLPPGSHLEGTAFRWLQRTLLPIPTR
jgi:hypothetical protein